MSEPHEEILKVQDTIAALIAARPYLAGIEALTERKGDLDTRIRAALGKIGLCITVMTPSFSGLKRVGDSLRFRTRIVVECAEIVLTNQSASGTKKPALAAALAVAKAIDLKPNGLDPAGRQHRAGINEIALDDDEPIRLVPDRTLLIYHVVAETDVQI